MQFNKVSDIEPIKHLLDKPRFDLLINSKLNTSSQHLLDKAKPEQIKQLEKEINVNFTKVVKLTAKKLIWERKTEFTIEPNGKISGIEICNCELSEIPKKLLEITNLETLILHSNFLGDISSLAKLTKLKNLELDNNKIEDISPLEELKELKTIGLTYNNIQDISPLKNLKKIQSLYLGNNKIKKIDIINEIAYFKNTDAFYFQNNQIENISVISNFPNLTKLDLDHNRVKDLSPLKELKKLEQLWLENNEVIDISPLKKLTKLKLLSLEFNQIKKVPKWLVFRDMEITWETNLLEKGFVTIYGNPIISPPIEIVAKGNKAIKNYYEQLKNETEKLFEAKLILVGEERAGKSTIVKALTNPDFRINFNIDSTKGIDIVKWVIPKEKTQTDRDFIFNVWDFGGQEIYHSTHQFFLTKRSLYLFVNEARKDFRYEDFYYWLNIINKLASNSPVIVIQNKFDQDNRNLSIDEFKEQFPQIVSDLQQISCNTEHKNWKNIYSKRLELLKNTIYLVIQNRELNGIGDELPKAWVEIRKEVTHLQNSKVNYISITEYKEICKKHGLNNEQAMMLSEYFNDLGVFLHFSKDIQLKNTVFLNYNWVTKAIYNVLDNEKVKETNGKFTDEDLMGIWSEPEYEEKQAQLINLMKNRQFKICFEHKDGYYLTPQLFSNKEIKTEWIDKPQNLRFILAYEFMPKGIISQLIVEMHHHIYENSYWLNGVIFRYGNSFALVKENRRSGKNNISIQTKGEQRRDLFILITAKLDEINKNFSNLSINELFACNCSECSASPTPYYYKTTLINKAIKKGKTSLECQNSFEDVDIDKLLGTYFSEKQLHEHRKKLTASILSNRKNDKIQQLNIASQLLKEYEEDLLLESDARKKMKYRIEIEALKQEIVKLENYFEKD